MKIRSRTLPDSDEILHTSSDFIGASQLYRRALLEPQPPSLAIFIRDLTEQIYRLQSSCHLPEFTDHGLSHLCSLVERISGWTLASTLQTFDPLDSLLSPSEAGVLLLATLFHDVGMLSQRYE